MTIVLSAVFSINTLPPFQILQLTISIIYHLFNTLPISDHYLLLLNLSKFKPAFIIARSFSN